MGNCQSLHSAVREGNPDRLKSVCTRARYIDFTESIEGLAVRLYCDTPSEMDGIQQWTALQLAAWSGKDDAVEILSEFGSDVNKDDEVVDQKVAFWKKCDRKGTLLCTWLLPTVTLRQ